MGYPIRRGRKTLRESLQESKSWLEFHAAAADKKELTAPGGQLEVKIPPKRHRIKRPVDGQPAMPLEKDVLADVLQALRNDPRVAIVDRRQSGVFQDGNRYIRVGQRGHLDISGMLRGGAYFEIEVKRNQQTKPQPLQQERIELIKRTGGISGYCWSIESALALLP